MAFQYDGVTYYGHLDAAGNFRPSPKYGPHSNKISGDLARLTNFVGKLPTQDVFEYRSDRLVKGHLDWAGNFTPELNSKVISFSEYEYSPSGLHIYNLPGRFIKKDKLGIKKPGGGR